MGGQGRKRNDVGKEVGELGRFSSGGVECDMSEGRGEKRAKPGRKDSVGG